MINFKGRSKLRSGRSGWTEIIFNMRTNAYRLQSAKGSFFTSNCGDYHTCQLRRKPIEAKKNRSKIQQNFHQNYYRAGWYHFQVTRKKSPKIQDIKYFNTKTGWIALVIILSRFQGLSKFRNETINNKLQPAKAKRE